MGLLSTNLKLLAAMDGDEYERGQISLRSHMI